MGPYKSVKFLLALSVGKFSAGILGDSGSELLGFLGCSMFFFCSKEGYILAFISKNLFWVCTQLQWEGPVGLGGFLFVIAPMVWYKGWFGRIKLSRWERIFSFFLVNFLCAHDPNSTKVLTFYFKDLLLCTSV